MTDFPHQPDATPGETADGRGDAAPSGSDEAVAAEAMDDAVVTDDSGEDASDAARAAADAATPDTEAEPGAETGPGQGAAEAEDDTSAPQEPAADGIDLEALAETDPRSKAELLGELVLAENRRDEYLDDLRRSHADFENYRRRVLREGGAQRDAGKAEVAGPLLEVLDDLDRTLAAADDSSDPDLAKGVALVASKLTTTLSRVGLERVDATGVAFDPNVHEAVQQQPADEPTDEPVVVQVLRPGYRLGQRTLRAAMVVVEQ